MRTMLVAIGAAALISGPVVAQTGAKEAHQSASAKGKGGKSTQEKGGGESDEKIAEDLKAFCVKWMGFLETRERDNKKGMKWETRQSGVAGHYVGYSKEYDCVMKERSSNGTPVATIQYKEYVYEKVGASRGEAEQAEPNVVDATEVTEIFRYTKGQWVY